MPLRADDGLLRAAGRFLRSPAVSITFFFLVSRIMYLAVFHVTFNASPLWGYWEYIDVRLLEHDLWNSLYYSYFEPPLFNAFLGIVLKLFPVHYAQAFQCIYLLMGYAFSLSLYYLMLNLKVDRRISLLLAVIHTIHPTTVLWENYLFYPYPIAFLCCVSALCLSRFLKTKRIRDGVAFFTLLAALVYLNNLFTPWWFFLSIGIVVFCCKLNRRMVILSAAMPLLLVVALMVKQEAVFGRIQMSQFFLNENAYQRLVPSIPDSIRRSLIAAGTVPAWCFKPPEQVISAFSPYIGPFPPTGIAVLDQEKKLSNAINFNHIGYLRQFDVCFPAYLRIIREYPQLYLNTLNNAITAYFVPSSDDYNYLHRPYYEGAFKLLTESVNGMLGQSRPGPDRIGWSLVFAFPLLIIAGCAMACYAHRRGYIVQWVTLLYMLFTIFYISAAAILIAQIEQNRFRLSIDAFYLALLGMCLTAFKNASLFSHPPAATIAPRQS